MSHPVQDMRTESVGQWLPLIEYSIKSGVSLSTIRRKIKANSIPFKLEKGKYLVFFKSGEAATMTENHLTDHSALPSNQIQIRAQEARIRELEQELSEMALLVQTLEKKFGVRY